MAHILYGIQGTGNGHIARSRILAAELISRGHEVDFIFSGREDDKYFDMDIFGDYITRRGLTIFTKNGAVDNVATIFRNNIFSMAQDAYVLSQLICDYDVVLCDYEPIVSLAGRIAGVKVIGISNQYTPLLHPARNMHEWVSKFIMDNFAPVDISVGLGWGKMPSTSTNIVIPPIVQLPENQPIINRKKILVYAPFMEACPTLHTLLKIGPPYQFVVYGIQQPKNWDSGDIVFRLPSVNGFTADFDECIGVICSAGFELLSRAIASDKGIYTCPLEGQVEQELNVARLPTRPHITHSRELDCVTIWQWLSSLDVHVPNPSSMIDSAKLIANWIDTGDLYCITDEMSDMAWPK